MQETDVCTRRLHKSDNEKRSIVQLALVSYSLFSLWHLRYTRKNVSCIPRYVHIVVHAAQFYILLTVSY